MPPTGRSISGITRGRVGRRLLPPRSALGHAGDRLRRHRQLHAALRLARRPTMPMRRARLDLRSGLPARQRRGRRGVRLVSMPTPPTARRRSARRSPTAPTARTGCFATRISRSWWSNPHVDRPGGVEAAQPTAWVPRSKPIWFTELGCPAVDKGPNQPNVFHDPKSSESFFPYFSPRLARRPDPAPLPPGDLRPLGRAGEQPGLGRLRAGGWSTRRAACLGLGRAALSRLSRRAATSGPTATTAARALAERPARLGVARRAWCASSAGVPGCPTTRSTPRRSRGRAGLYHQRDRKPARLDRTVGAAVRLRRASRPRASSVSSRAAGERWRQSSSTILRRRGGTAR